MAELYTAYTTSGFERDMKRIHKKNPLEADTIIGVIGILKIDPYNIKRHYDIKKLVGIKQGEGEYRIRHGDYRIRYDIFNKDVILYSVRNRKDAY